MVYYTEIDTLLGIMVATADEQGLRSLSFTEGDGWQGLPKDASRDDDMPVLRDTSLQVQEYYAGTRQDFDLPLAPQGTDFQRKVWQALQDIPFGETRSYAGLAGMIRQPTASRAVGLANGRNPIAVIIPCHRVIGADGSLTGYAGGLRIKKALLEIENALPQAMLL